jgi:signal peptidase I
VITTIKRLRKNAYFQTIIYIVLIVLIIFGFFAAMILGFLAVVPTGSMCIPYDGACDGWTHPFDRTIHVGDILVIQPINPADLNANYPNSDIIVYNTQSHGRIVHRIVAKLDDNGTLSFYTKGDGNGWNKWPNTPIIAEYDPWSPVPQNMIIGKVVMRIPWIGHIALFMQNTLGQDTKYLTIPVVVIIIVLLLVIEFVLPLFRRKETQTDQQTTETPRTQMCL